jgi:two-component system, chemotaxis family, sensor kinase CheA
MDDLLQDFLTEAAELLAVVDNKLVDLEKRPQDKHLLNEIFRGFHTIKGGAGFLNLSELVALCHLTENLFDLLRNGQMSLTAETLDVILDATAAVRNMFDCLSQSAPMRAASPALLKSLEDTISGKPAPPSAPMAAENSAAAAETAPVVHAKVGLDWQAAYEAVLGGAQSIATTAAAPIPANDPAEEKRTPAAGRRNVDQPDTEGGRSGRRDNDRVVVSAEPTTIRIDTSRLDQVLNLSGEIGLAKNRLNCLRTDLLQGRTDVETMRALDQAVSHLDLLVSDLQNAVMKTRMQPVGRLFQRYPRVARDLARALGKDVELQLSGEETELDKTMIEDLNDPLIHLVRNAVDHGIETPQDRSAQGKPEKSIVHLSAQQIGDSILIEIVDDGRGMRPDVLRRKAVEKGVITADVAANMDDQDALRLIFLPGFSTKEQANDVSGRGVGMDVVKTKIQKLNGRIEINSVIGQGTTFLHLPPADAGDPPCAHREGRRPAIRCTTVDGPRDHHHGA